MDLRLTAREQAFAAEARAWLHDHVPRGLPPSGSADGFAAHVAWERQLFDAGWAVVSWPRAFGGRDASWVEWLLFEDAYYRAGGPPRVTQNGIFLLAPALFEHGTDEQRQRLLRPMAAAETLWAQGWSEPGAGSDLAAVRSTAVRVDGGWRLSGQKTWSTRASFCHAMHGLFRTDPDAPRHRGLTYFLVPLDAPGVRVSGFRRLDGDLDFADVFLDDVFVADHDVVGAPGQGWKVAMSTTGSERGLILRSPGRFVAAARRLVALYRRERAVASPLDRDQVVRAWMAAQAYQLYTLQDVTRVAGGAAMGASSSINKLAWSELDVQLHDAALALLGPRAELVEGAPDAVDGGAWIKGWQFALAGPIYAGTNEIQRNVIAERLLGLPKE
ncbi:MAG: acyl-CoA dehydrogenase family protein [Kofleriaceae bacterium]|nr:acyl-CoA dehydrogenase family protein [Kofleriaceae bacterium]MCB9573819.1 acyl-CoA dehydrogenase family protein [Kofleriaceae bacterium]